MSDATNPETGVVDAPVSMDSIIAEIGTGNPSEDKADEVVSELVEQTEEGQAEAADDGEGKTDDAQDEAETPDEDSPTEEVEPAGSERYTVKVDGVEQKVTLAELKAGYSRTQDYTAKTQALATERRGLEQTLSQQFADQLKQATDLFVSVDPLLSEADKIDWQALAQQDPTAYTQLRAAMDARIEAVTKARGEIERVNQARAQEAQAAQEQGLKDTEAAIRSMDASFADDTKFSAFVSEAVSTLRAVGLDGEDVMGIMSNPKIGPQVANLVRDAQRWRSQEKARSGLPGKKIVPAPAAKSLRSDASAGTPSPRKMPAAANSDQRAAFVVDQLLQG